MRKLTALGLTAAAAAGFFAAAPAQAAPTGGGRSVCVGDLETKGLQCFGSDAEASSAIDARRGWIPLVTFYDGSGYSGSKLVLGHSRGACTATLGDVNYALPNLGTYGWNNKAGSFTTQNRCDLMGYDGTSYTGDRFRQYQDHDIQLVRWNNDISSFRLS